MDSRAASMLTITLVSGPLGVGVALPSLSRTAAEPPPPHTCPEVWRRDLYPGTALLFSRNCQDRQCSVIQPCYLSKGHQYACAGKRCSQNVTNKNKMPVLRLEQCFIQMYTALGPSTQCPHIQGTTNQMTLDCVVGKKMFSAILLRFFTAAELCLSQHTSVLESPVAQEQVRLA